MDSDRVNRWLTLLANVGVLIGLILLTIEVRHAIDLAELEAYRHRGTEIQEAMQQLALSSDLAGVVAKSRDAGVEALSPAERVRLNAWYLAMVFRMQNQFNDYQLGYLDEAPYRAMLRSAAATVSISEQLGVDIETDFDPAFVQAVRGAVAD
jgi:hypothetical protein